MNKYVSRVSLTFYQVIQKVNCVKQLKRKLVWKINCIMKLFFSRHSYHSFSDYHHSVAQAFICLCQKAASNANHVLTALEKNRDIFNVNSFTVIVNIWFSVFNFCKKTIDNHRRPLASFFIFVCFPVLHIHLHTI